MSWPSSETGSEILALGLDLGDDGMSAVTYESDTERPKKKKSSLKPPRSPKSPYHTTTSLHSKKSPVWRSLKGTGFKHTENPVAKMPRNLWLSSLKQGLTQPLKSDFDTGQAWVGSSSSTPEYLKQALGMKKPKYSRSASNGYIPGTPDYKEKEDMYDEIIELKKTLQTQRSEGDVIKTKLRRLEEENSKKDRQIEQLLDPSKSSDFSRSLVDKRNDSSLVMNGLKQKILRLEQQCKEKDNMLNKLQTELKTTSLEEMKIAMETYYVEIQRLQMLLAKFETTEKKVPTESKSSQKNQKTVNAALLKLSKNIKELQEENQSLKVDLERAIGGSPTSNRSTSNKSKGYIEWSKQRLVRRITELEKKASELDTTQLPSSDLEKSANDVSRVQAQPNQNSSPASDVSEECARLRGLVKNLKGDRSALQSMLASKDLEIKQLQQTRNHLERELRKLEKEKENGRKEILQLTQKVKSLEDGVKEQVIQAHYNKKDSRPPGSASPQSRPGSAKSTSSVASLPRSACSDGGRGERKREKAAEVIQTHWRQYKAKKEIDDFDKVATVLQSAFRGHLARQKLLSSRETSISKSLGPDNVLQQHANAARSSRSSSLPSDASVEEEAVTILQSAFRAHVARIGKVEESVSVSSSVGTRSSSRNLNDKKSTTPPPRHPSKQAFNSPLDNDDTDVSEELIEEPLSEEEDHKLRRQKELNFSSRQQSPAQPYHKRQPSFSPPSNSDSDDIIISPSLPSKRRTSKF
ncbi:IQ domain-containing protein E isoform X2 [Ambystoma mexicanum]|uniref:IQ domain-containing protein E isoform X2 n=1 Tax=Ambystoma mexicanum TaxID=8296 RepID=UPI0037E85459